MDDPFGYNRAPSKPTITSPYLSFDPSILNTASILFNNWVAEPFAITFKSNSFVN